MFRLIGVPLLVALCSVNSTAVYAENTMNGVEVDSASKYEKFSFFIRGDSYMIQDSFGVGATLGIAYVKEESVFTLRTTRLIDFFGELGDGFTDAFNGEGSANTEDNISISEISFLYGRRWDNFIFSVGVGSIKVKNLGDIFIRDNERIDLSETGVAYSLIWGGPYTGVGFELSGNLNSAENLYMASLGLYF